MPELTYHSSRDFEKVNSFIQRDCTQNSFTKYLGIKNSRLDEVDLSISTTLYVLKGEPIIVESRFFDLDSQFTSFGDRFSSATVYCSCSYGERIRKNMLAPEQFKAK